MKKDSVFSNLLNKFIKKDNSKSNLNKVNVNMHDVSSSGKSFTERNSTQNFVPGNEFKSSLSKEMNNSSAGVSKSLEIIKQKKKQVKPLKKN